MAHTGIGERDLPELLRGAVARGGAGDPWENAHALAGLAVAVADVDRERTSALLARGAGFADAASPQHRGSALRELAFAAFTAGEPALAEELVFAIADEKWRLSEYLRLMRLADPASLPAFAARAEDLLWRIDDPDWAAQKAASLASLLATADPPRAGALLDYSEALLPALRDREETAWVLASLSEAAQALGDPSGARSFLDRAEPRVAGLPEEQAMLLTLLVDLATSLGDQDRARAFADTAEARLLAADPAPRVMNTLELAASVRAAGDGERAHRLIDTAEHIAPSLTDPVQQALAWTEVAKAVSGPPSPDPARALACDTRAQSRLPAIPALPVRAWTLTRLNPAAAPAPARAFLPQALSEAPWSAALTTALAAFPAASPETRRRLANVFLT